MKPIRNPKYLAWIRTLPCIICGRTGRIEAAHTGPHGIAQKSSDTSAVPLCSRHHRTGRDSYHKLGARAFERHHDIDLRLIVARLNVKPCVRIDHGIFVGRLGDDNYILGPVGIGLRAAVRQILAIKSEDRSWRSLDGDGQPDMREFLRIRSRLQAEFNGQGRTHFAGKLW